MNFGEMHDLKTDNCHSRRKYNTRLNYYIDTKQCLYFRSELRLVLVVVPHRTIMRCSHNDERLHHHDEDSTAERVVHA